jgi:hypothetical protein
MEFIDPPEEEPRSGSRKDKVFATGKQFQQKTRVLVQREMKPSHPVETDGPSGTTLAGEPASHLFPGSDQGAMPRNAKATNPGRRLHAFEAAAIHSPPARVPWQYRLRPNRELTHRAYWDVAATFSLIVNAILIGLLLILAGQVRNLRATVNGLLGGLYGNIARMDQANINKTIQVNAQIPLDITVPFSQNTDAVLNSDVSIPNAHLIINTGLLRLNTQANVMLPAGTVLPVSLNLSIPVKSTIPVSLQVPVNIPLSQTGLHDPLTGLQASLRPLTCMLDKNAQYPTGIYLCAEHDVPIPGVP